MVTGASAAYKNEKGGLALGGGSRTKILPFLDLKRMTLVLQEFLLNYCPGNPLRIRDERFK